MEAREERRGQERRDRGKYKSNRETGRYHRCSCWHEVNALNNFSVLPLSLQAQLWSVGIWPSGALSDTLVPPTTRHSPPPFNPHSNDTRFKHCFSRMQNTHPIYIYTKTYTSIHLHMRTHAHKIHAHTSINAYIHAHTNRIQTDHLHHVQRE